MKMALGLCIALFAANIQAAEKDKDKPKEGNYQTTMDFDSSMIDGKMKAPSGFFLQGRNRQSLSNMVKLRSNFSNRLRDSEAAVKALVK
jgi:hypothetical protein